MVTGGVPQRDRTPVEPAHLLIQPMTPLRVEFIRIGGQASDLVAGEHDEFGRRHQAADGGVDGGEGLLMPMSRNA